MHSVLIIDDQQDLLDITRLFLERFGEMNVDTAKTAKEALAKMKDRSYDALVVDFDLPDISGIEFLKIVRAKGDTTPIIIFTGVGRENAAIEALNNGADFFLKKGEDPHAQFRNMVHMINQAVERRSMGRAIGTSERLLAETIAFFSEPAYALDREGKVIAWNLAMAEFTGIEAKNMLGKGDGKYSVPIFGRKMPMLTDMIFDDENTIVKNGYTIISKEPDSVTAWIKTTGTGGEDRFLWMKASALHDGKGVFVSSIGTVKDITDELGPELSRLSAVAGQDVPLSSTPSSSKAGRLDKLLGRGRSSYKKGLFHYYREGNHPEAIRYFDQALEIDPYLAAAWHDRGVCLRELGRDEDALKSIDKACEIEPENEEFLFTRAELLKRIGILRGQKNAIAAAVKTFNKVLEINPNNADAWNGLAVCMKEQGRDEISRQYYERAQNLVRWGKAKRKVRNLDTIV
ncbi:MULTISPECIES: response regulator [unclassified Methanoregula]|uniref:response regulator n=1 Tax=unclassified Methanoregula TaxID=2649730 RepID=UPI0009C438A5|nr:MULTISPECIES: response regulator [unclassified Methanoregula]OPX63604.1 MAG: response regulator FixJ [Methanoregula sp. PtaB.Bin085]OPY36230.1 MAG: response regulator FixJ [Methanoregula sp. PtaU1.Bin006]